MANKKNNKTNQIIQSNQINQNTESADVIIAKLNLIGTLLSTIGDGLQTLAASITLQELENDTSQQTQTTQNSQYQIEQSRQIEQLQRQVDYLIKKIDKR